MQGSKLYSIDERKQRWSDFLDMESATRFVFLIDYYKDAPTRPIPWPNKRAERVEWILKMYERQMEQAQWLRDDTIPCLDMLTGTEIFAEAFGCKVYRAENEMPFALPLISSAREVSDLKVPELSSSSLAYLFDMADELQERAGKDALFRLVDIQSPMDIAALIWNKNDFYPSMIFAPEAVEELASKVYELLTAFLDEWFARYGYEFVAHYPTYYMPKGITLSEDEIGAVSEEMFVEFFLPHLAALSERYGGIGIHCCAHAKHQWSNFKKVPNLKLLNLGEPKKELVKIYKFFAEHVAQMHSWDEDVPVELLLRELPEAAHVVFQATAKSRDEAIALSDKLWAICGRD